MYYLLDKELHNCLARAVKQIVYLHMKRKFVYLMSDRIIAIYGKEKRCKIFHILITAIASKQERSQCNSECTFLD